MPIPMPLEFLISLPFSRPENHLTNENRWGTHERLMAVMRGFLLQGVWGLMSNMQGSTTYER